jgi:uncharacterized membrane protein HdeD (DUF308 family)
MLEILSRNWWLFAIRGVAAIVFGVLALLWPGPTLAVLVALFAVYALVDGAALLVSLARGGPRRRPTWMVGVMGVIGIAAGIVAIVWPGITALALLYVVAFWSIALGMTQLWAAISLRREIEGELWMAVGGVVAIIFGLYLAIFPGSGLLSVIWLLGIWSIVFGVSSLLLATRLRGHAERWVPSPRRQPARQVHHHMG